MINEERSYTEYAVVVPTTDFVVGYDFIDNGVDITEVTLNGVDPTTIGYTVLQVNNTTYRFAPPVESGIVRLSRVTDIDTMAHVFTEGAIFVSENMDGNFKQIRHAQQEVRDNFGVLQRDFSGLEDTVLPLVDGLEVALQAAESAATAAGEAADIAVAVQTDIAQKFPNGKLKAVDVLNASTETQQQINDFGGAKWYTKSGGYELGATVVLANSDIVKSLTPNNTNNPNISMLGWVKVGNEYVVETIADLLLIQGMQSGNIANVLSYRAPNLAEATPYRGGGRLVFDASKIALNDGVSVFNGWVRVKQEDISPFSAGAVGDGVFDDQPSFQKAVNYLSSVGGGTLHLPIPRVSYFLNSKTEEETSNPNAIVQWKPNVSVKGEGEKSKIKVGAFSDSKFYMFYNYTDELGDVSFENFSIDANGQENLPTSGMGYDHWIIATARAKSVTIERVHVSNAGGQQIFSIGTNNEVPTVDIARISKCNIKKVATDIIGNIQHDHSSVYVAVNRAMITNNVFKNDSENRVATAIECHSIKQIITGNIIENFNVGVITASAVRNISDVLIANNEIRSRIAWQIWTAGSFHPKKVMFCDNLCTEDASDNIAFLDTSGFVLNHINGTVAIKDNLILGSGKVINTDGFFGIYAGDIKHLSISGNVFENIVGETLRLGKVYSDNIVKVDFVDNEVINCTTTTNPEYQDIIAFNTTDSIKRLSIKGNTFTSESSTYSNRVIAGVCDVDFFEFTGNTDVGDGFTAIADWYTGKLKNSKIEHTTKLQGKPTIAASPLSKWLVTSAPVRTYQRFGGAGVTNVWHTTHYVNDAPPVAEGLSGDRAINMLPMLGRPPEWVCISAGNPATWAAMANLVAVT